MQGVEGGVIEQPKEGLAPRIHALLLVLILLFLLGRDDYVDIR